MRRLTLALLLALAAGPASAQSLIVSGLPGPGLPGPEPAAALPLPTFAGIRWGSSSIEVQIGAAAAGLTLVERDAEGDYAYTGTLFDVPAVVYLFMSPTEGFVKAQVRLSSASAPTRTYADVVDHLTRQYGATEPVEFFKPPYARGDGRTDEAVRAGKAVLVSAWGDERQPGKAALVVRVSRTTVGLDYESHAWIAEYARRQEEPVPSGGGIASGARPRGGEAGTTSQVEP